MGFICCLDSVLNDRRLDWILLHHVDHVQTCTIDTTTLITWEQQNAAFGGRINNYSPTNHSLSSVRGDSSLSQLFCSLCVDVYGVCMLFWLRFDWEKAWYWQKRTYSCNWGNRLSPFSSRWPCTDLHNWYYNIAHVRANRMPPLGVDKTILSPPKRSLSPTRGDSSLSQLFLFIFVDVCIVYVMFLAFGGRHNAFFITLAMHTL